MPQRPDPAQQRAELLERYRHHLVVERYRSPATWRHYRRALTAFWDFCGKPWQRCSATDLHRFLTRRAHPGGNSRGPRLADSSRHTYAGYVRACYRWAAAERLLKRDPMAGVALPPRRLGPPRALQLHQVAAVLEHAATDPRLHVMVWLAYGCGLRVGGIATLQVQDIVLTGRPHLRVQGKGGRQRLVPLHPRVAGVLVAFLDGRPQTGPLVCSAVRPGQPLKPRTVSKLLSAALKAAKVRASAHQLRHTFATELLAAGKGQNLRAVSYLLGHASIASTERYVLAYNADAWAAIEGLPDPARARNQRRRT